MDYEHVIKGREVSISELEGAVRSSIEELNECIMTNEKLKKDRIYAAFARQFQGLIRAGDIEWQFRPSIKKRKNGKREAAEWLFDLVWYNVVRIGELCLLHDIALIVESELSGSQALVQHDFLKLLCVRSLLKVAIVKCSEKACRNLVKNAIRECRNVTEGRYMVWRLAGSKIVLEAGFDLYWEEKTVRYKIFGGEMFQGKSLLPEWEELKGSIRILGKDYGESSEARQN